MSGFYYNENNFEYLYEEVSVLLSNTIMENDISKEWLCDLYKDDEYNVTRAIEMYNSDILINNILENNVDEKVILNAINKRKSELFISESFNITDSLNNLNFIEECRYIDCNIEEILKSYKLMESIEYLEERLNLKEKFKNFKIKNENVLNLIRVFESLKRIIRKKPLESEEVQLIKTEVDKLLYEYKSFEYTGKEKVVGILKGVLARRAEELSLEEIQNMINDMKNSLENNPDYMIQYIIDKFKYLKKLIEEKEGQGVVSESFEYSNYLEKVSEFDNLVESIFFGEDEPNLNDFIRLHMLTEGLINYEETMEASSRIITKGTGKVVKAIDNVSAKSTGMSSSKSKVGQVKRNARITGNRVADAISKKVNDLLEKQKNERRKRVITGSISVKLLQLLKRAIGLVVGSKLIGKMIGPAATKAVKVAGKTILPSVSLGPLVSVVITIVIALGKFALDKRADERERKRVLTELETELKIVREKIEDAKGDNARQQKYELMRIEASLEKEVTRIKYGLRPE
jgi:hypothetical protein